MADKSLTDVIDTTARAAKQEPVTVERLVQALGPASIAPVLLLPALIVVSPISGIPGVSIAGGLIIALIAGQIAFGRRSIWLPGFVLRLKLPGDKLRKGLEAMRKPAASVDSVIHRRVLLPAGLQRRVLGAVAMVIGLCMPVLEFLPFTSSIAAGVVALLALAMLVEDGLLAIVAVGLLAGIVALVFWLI